MRANDNGVVQGVESETKRADPPATARSLGAGSDPQWRWAVKDHRQKTLYGLQSLADAVGVSLSSLGRMLGLSGSTWKQYRDEGVTERVADRLACKAGLHPAMVWPTWVDDLIAAFTRECEAHGCTAGFVPGQPSQRFCSEACRNRAKRRRHYEIHGEQERARQRAYDRARSERRDAA